VEGKRKPSGNERNRNSTLQTPGTIGRRNSYDIDNCETNAVNQKRFMFIAKIPMVADECVLRALLSLVR
jgi:hypothetical protein